MRCRILKGIHGFTTPGGAKFTAAPGEEVDLTPEQYARLGPRRAVALEPIAVAAVPAAVAARPQEPVDEETEPPAAPAAPGAAADAPGRWAGLLKLKANRLKDAIGKLGSIEEIESLIVEESAGRDRFGIKKFASERIEELKQQKG